MYFRISCDLVFIMWSDVREVFDLFDFWDGRDGLVDGFKLGDFLRCCGLNPTVALVNENGGTKKLGINTLSPSRIILTLYSAKVIIVPHRIIIWYTGRWWVGCYIWFSRRREPTQTPHRCTHQRPVYQSLYCCIMVRCCAVLMYPMVKQRQAVGVQPGAQSKFKKNSLNVDVCSNMAWLTNLHKTARSYCEMSRFLHCWSADEFVICFTHSLVLLRCSIFDCLLINSHFTSYNTGSKAICTCTVRPVVS